MSHPPAPRRRRHRAIAAAVASLLLSAGGLFAASAASADPSGQLDVPSTIDAGREFTVSGDGCLPYPGGPQTTVLLTVNGEPETLAANADGTWIWGIGGSVPGTVSIEASCDGYAGYIAYDTATVEVVDNATVAVTPSAPVSGDEITLTGTGWYYNCDCMPPAIEAVLTDGENTWLLGTSDDAGLGGWTNFDGEFDGATVTIPADLPAGEYQLIVAQGEYHRATTSITVNGFVPVAVSAAVSSPTVAAGDSIEVTGTGFVPGEDVRVELHSTPVTLTTATASPEGEIAVRVTIPRDTATGAHEIVLVGETSARTASADLTVTAATTAGTGTGATGTTATGTLAATGGSAPIALTAAAGLTLLLGAAVIVTARRRSARG